MAAQYFLARCISKLGKTATAYKHFKEVRDISARVGHTERAETAAERIAELEPRLMRIVVSVDAEEAGLRVSLDDETLPPPKWGRAIPYDPGTHVVRAMVPGFDPWEQTVTLNEPGKTVTVKVPQFSSTIDPVPADPVPDPEDPDTASDGPPALLISGIAVGVLGLGGMVVSGVLAAQASSTYDDSDAFCDDTGCDPQGLDLVDEARGLGNGATAAFVIGGVFLAAGVTMIVVSVVTDDDEPDTTTELGIGPTGRSLAGHVLMSVPDSAIATHHAIGPIFVRHAHVRRQRDGHGDAQDDAQHDRRRSRPGARRIHLWPRRLRGDARGEPSLGGARVSQRALPPRQRKSATPSWPRRSSSRRWERSTRLRSRPASATPASSRGR